MAMTTRSKSKTEASAAIPIRRETKRPAPVGRSKQRTQVQKRVVSASVKLVSAKIQSKKTEVRSKIPDIPVSLTKCVLQTHESDTQEHDPYTDIQRWREQLPEEYDDMNKPMIGNMY